MTELFNLKRGDKFAAPAHPGYVFQLRTHDTTWSYAKVVTAPPGADPSKGFILGDDIDFSALQMVEKVT